MKDSFEGYHPFVNLLYFTLVIGFSLALTHPVAQGISLASAVAYALAIEGRKKLTFILKFCLPMMLLTAFINPVFSHEGVTVLLYFGNGNPLTLYENDSFVRKNLIKTRLTQEDVISQVRINGYSDMTDVSKVVLERTGKMSVLPKESNTPNQSGG